MATLLTLIAMSIGIVHETTRQLRQDCTERGLVDDLMFGIERTDYWSYDVQEQGVKFHNHREDIALFSNLRNLDGSITGVSFEVKFPPDGGLLVHRLYKGQDVQLRIQINPTTVTITTGQGVVESQQVSSEFHQKWINIRFELSAASVTSSSSNTYSQLLFVNGQPYVFPNTTTSQYPGITSADVTGVGNGVLFRNRNFFCTEYYPLEIQSITESGPTVTITTMWDLPKSAPTNHLELYLSSMSNCQCCADCCDVVTASQFIESDGETYGQHVFITDYSGTVYYICTEGYPIGSSNIRYGTVVSEVITIPITEVSTVCAGESCFGHDLLLDVGTGLCTTLYTSWFPDGRCCDILYCDCPLFFDGLQVDTSSSVTTYQPQDTHTCFYENVPFYSKHMLSDNDCVLLSKITCYMKCFSHPNEHSDCSGYIDHDAVCHKTLADTPEGCSEVVTCRDGEFSPLDCEPVGGRSTWPHYDKTELQHLGGNLYEIIMLPNFSCHQIVQTTTGSMKLSSSIETMETRATLDSSGEWKWSIDVSCVDGCAAPHVVGAHPLQVIAANGEVIHWASESGYYCNNLISQCEDHSLTKLPECVKYCLIPTELHIILRCANTIPVVGAVCTWEPDTLSDCALQSATVTCKDNGFSSHPDFQCIHRNLATAPIHDTDETTYSEGSFEFSISIDSPSNNMFVDNNITPTATLTAEWLRTRIAEILTGEYIYCKVVILQICHLGTTCVDVNGGVSYSTNERSVVILETDATFKFAIFPSVTSTVRAQDISHILGLVLQSGTSVTLSSDVVVVFNSELSLTKDTTTSRTPYPEYSAGSKATMVYSTLLIAVVMLLL